jgi:2-C-methyl-D-erythritol 2,4-cyclodiphosphate synthase
METEVRVGFGYDIHPLKRGRKLFLGGVEIPSDVGLDGHSDADVLLHALCDALLGALARGDIGEHFPDTVEATKGMKSALMVEEVLAMDAFEIVNVDATVIAEQPMLSPHKGQIRKNIAALLHIDTKTVSIKAKRNEGFGPIGEGKAIACFAIVLIKLQNNDYTDST